MKNLRLYATLLAMLLCINMVSNQSLLKAQSQSNTINWTYKVWHVEYENNIAIILPPGFKTSYVVGVKAGENSIADFVVGEVNVAVLEGGLKVVAGVENLSSTLVRKTKNNFEILNSSDSSKKLAILGTVLPGTRIKLLSGQEIIASGVVGSSGLLISNGSLVSKPVNGMRSVINELTQKEQGVEDLSPKKLPNGRYFVSLGGLKRNASVVVRPLSVSQSDGCCGKIVKVKVLIDTQGSVSSVEPAGSELEPALDKIRQAVARWKFMPFKVNGAAVTTESILPFFIEKNGQIQSPLS